MLDKRYKYKTLKTSLIALFILLCSFFVNAQQERISDNFLGINLGGTYFRMNMNIPEQSVFVKGYTVGLTYKSYVENYKRVSMLGTIISLNYTQKGGSSFFVYSNPTDTLNPTNVAFFYLNTKYIELPVLATGRLGMRNNRINIYVGPHLGFLISEKQSFPVSKPEVAYNETLDFKTDFGINFGLGYERKIGSSIVGIDVIYSHGLSNIYKSRTVNNALIYKNQGFKVTVSYLFHFKKKSEDVKDNKS